MQIYGIYVLYCNTQIHLELNRYTIIYAEKLFFFKIYFGLLMQVQTSYLRWTGGRSIEVK